MEKFSAFSKRLWNYWHKEKLKITSKKFMQKSWVFIFPSETIIFTSLLLPILIISQFNYEYERSYILRILKYLPTQRICIYIYIFFLHLCQKSPYCIFVRHDSIAKVENPPFHKTQNFWRFTFDKKYSKYFYNLLKIHNISFRVIPIYK